MAHEYRSQEPRTLLDEFVRLLSKAGEDDQGIQIDIDHAIGEVEELFSETDQRALREEGVLTWHLVWRRSGRSVSDVSRDFHRLVGEFAEETEFISQFVEADSIRYEVILGSLRGQQHVHHVRFRIGGPNMARICSEWRRMGETFR